MIVVGLTAGTGCGASTIARLLKKKGFALIEADEVSRSVLKPNSLEWRTVIRVFGKQILNRNGEIDRTKLGSAAFADKKSLGKLNKIMLAPIIKKIRAKIKELEKQKKQIIVLEAPLLVETSLLKDIDFLVVITAGLKTRIHRIVERDFLYPEEAVKRINAQLPLEAKTEKADFIIDNNGNVSETKKQVEKLEKKLNLLVKKK